MCYITHWQKETYKKNFEISPRKCNTIFSARNTKIYKKCQLRKVIFSLLYNISPPNFAVLLNSRCSFLFPTLCIILLLISASTYSVPVSVRGKSFPCKSPSLAATSNENPFLRRWNSRTHVNLFSGFVDTSEGCRVRSIRPQRTADLNCSETCEKMRWGTISRSGHMYKVSSVHPHPLPLCNLKHGFQHFAYDLRNISSEILSWSMRFFSKGFKDNRCAQVHKNTGLNLNIGLALT